MRVGDCSGHVRGLDNPSVTRKPNPHQIKLNGVPLAVYQ
jgi:hypothetical protein